MQRTQATARIPASPSELFAFIADPANLPAWQTGIRSAELTSAGPVGCGSTARIVRDLLGRRITAELRMTGFEPDRRLVLESTVSGIRAEATLELEPAEAGTRLRFGLSFTATSFVMAPIEGMAAGAARQDLATSLDRLRAHFSGGGREADG